MRDFFRGWRRKMGCVTLVMACVFVVGWVRSQTTSDRLRFPLGESVVATLTSDESAISIILDVKQESSLRRSWFGTWCGLKDSKANNVKFIPIPYLPIVIPLTLLSAYLLLGKPRVAKPNIVGKTPAHD